VGKFKANTGGHDPDKTISRYRERAGAIGKNINQQASMQVDLSWCGEKPFLL
jgi:hypothetical protein